MISISSLLNPVAQPSMSRERLPSVDRPTLPGVRELFPDLPRSAFKTPEATPRVISLSPPAHLDQGLHPHQPRMQHPQHARRPSNPTNVPMPIPQYLTSPRPRSHPDSATSASPASASPATPSPSTSSASANSSPLYQVLALGPNGLNAVQTETERPIGIYRQDKRRHHVMSAPSSDSETRRYVCQDCGVSFMRPSELRTHQHRHTGRKAYICTRCGKDFATSSNLSRHVRTLHPGETLAKRRMGGNSGHSSSSAASTPPFSEGSDA